MTLPISTSASLVYGQCQTLLGMSRSGSTITGGLLLGYGRAAAAGYSLLPAIPRHRHARLSRFA